MKRMLPPTFLLICLIVMALLHGFLPITTLVPAPFNLLGIAFLAVGIVVNLVADGAFHLAQTTVKTFDEPDRLVVDGLFRYSRNPMYLGFELILIGVWVLLGSASPNLGPVLFFVVANWYYIPFEEKMLAKQFGQQFGDYRRRTRRWI
jgi:protein-S-isoprenylcysteine O-methyltransferase Ste14